MKESILVEMRNKIDTLAAVLQRVTTELTHLSDLSIGTMELVKQLDGYEEALNKLKQSIQDAKDKRNNKGSEETDTKLDLGTELPGS